MAFLKIRKKTVRRNTARYLPSGGANNNSKIIVKNYYAQKINMAIELFTVKN